MSLFLTIRIEDGDNPERARQEQVECKDLWSAIYELENVAGSRFVRQLATLSWHLLTEPRDKRGDPPSAVAIP